MELGIVGTKQKNTKILKKKKTPRGNKLVV